jgi:hypothetical protein
MLALIEYRHFVATNFKLRGQCNMYGMGLVLPIGIGVLVLIAAAGAIIGLVAIFAGPPILALCFTIFLLRKADVRQAPFRTLASCLFAIGAYAYCYNLMIYFIFWKDHTLPLGMPFLNPFDAGGIILGFFGFLLPLILLDPHPWKRLVENGGIPWLLPGALFINTLMAWPLLLLVAAGAHVSLDKVWGWGWGWAFMLTIPAIVLIQVNDR